LSVYSIYKETHSSDGSATHERHYAGWAADRDEAILRANELYQGRDSIEAVVVIGNGPTGVEVIYRVDDENGDIASSSVRADELSNCC
jgi:NADH dehydrogenase FAD-containing subunit